MISTNLILNFTDKSYIKIIYILYVKVMCELCRKCNFMCTWKRYICNKWMHFLCNILEDYIIKQFKGIHKDFDQYIFNVNFLLPVLLLCIVYIFFVFTPGNPPKISKSCFCFENLVKCVFAYKHRVQRNTWNLSEQEKQVQQGWGGELPDMTLTRRLALPFVVKSVFWYHLKCSVVLICCYHIAISVLKVTLWRLNLLKQRAFDTTLPGARRRKIKPKSWGQWKILW